VPDPNPFDLHFSDQITFFLTKLNVPTETWDQLQGQIHDHAFTVAGAMDAQLLNDLREIVDDAIRNGTTLDEFRAGFDALVERNGWTGWTGEGTEAGKAWRTRVIYETNLRTSYAAGRWAQIQQTKTTRPYLQYRHADGEMYPRPIHVGWDGLILPVDDPWWETHYPPSGFGCRCKVFSLSDRDLERLGRTVDEAPKSMIDPATGLPEGVDAGWGYAPGRGGWEPDVSKWPPEFVKALDDWLANQ
jgi:SPP1 gp7 family putative phage head morphogenesis protein